MGKHALEVCANCAYRIFYIGSRRDISSALDTCLCDDGEERIEYFDDYTTSGYVLKFLDIEKIPEDGKVPIELVTKAIGTIHLIYNQVSNKDMIACIRRITDSEGCDDVPFLDDAVRASIHRAFERGVREGNKNRHTLEKIVENLSNAISRHYTELIELDLKSEDEED